MPFDIAQTLEELAQRLAGFSYVSAEARIADVYRMAQFLILDRLGTTLRADPATVPSQLQHLLLDVNRRYRQAALYAQKWAALEARSAFEAGGTVATKLLRMQGLPRLSISFASPSLHAIDAIAQETMGDLLAATRRTEEWVKDRVRRVVLEETRGMAATGIRGVDGAARITERLADENIFGVFDKNGSFISMDEYARTVAHIKLREAQTRGTEAMLLDNGYDLVQVSTHTHRPDSCSQYEGKVFSLTGRTPGYPRIERHTPYHPGCRHCETPYVTTFRSNAEIASDQAESNRQGPIIVYDAALLQGLQDKQRARNRFLYQRRKLSRKDTAEIIRGTLAPPKDLDAYKKDLNKRARAGVRALDRARARKETTSGASS